MLCAHALYKLCPNQGSRALPPAISHSTHTGLAACVVHCLYVNVNVNNLLAISKSDFDNSGEPGPQAEGVNQGGYIAPEFDHCTA